VRTGAVSRMDFCVEVSDFIWREFSNRAVILYPNELASIRAIGFCGALTGKHVPTSIDQCNEESGNNEG